MEAKMMMTIAMKKKKNMNMRKMKEDILIASRRKKQLKLHPMIRMGNLGKA